MSAACSGCWALRMRTAAAAFCSPAPSGFCTQDPTSMASVGPAQRLQRGPIGTPSRWQWQAAVTGVTLRRCRQPRWASCGAQAQGCLPPHCPPRPRPPWSARVRLALCRPQAMAVSLGARGRRPPKSRQPRRHQSVLLLVLWWAHWVSDGRRMFAVKAACKMPGVHEELHTILPCPHSLQLSVPLPSWRCDHVGAGYGGAPLLLAARCCLTRRGSRGGKS